MDEKERKKWMTVSLSTSLAPEGICLFVDLSRCGKRSLVSGDDDDDDELMLNVLRCHETY